MTSLIKDNFNLLCSEKMLKSLISIVPVGMIEKFEHYLLDDYLRTKHFLNTVDSELLECISQKKALSVFNYAAKQTPAYKDFLKKKRINLSRIKTIDDFNALVPATDKENYVKKYSYELRCRQGHLPTHGNVDESGGTSGIATNWIHDISEEDLLFKAVKFEVSYSFGGDKKNLFVISAWSSGPWATGIKFCELMERITLVKNTASDTKDIINTLKMFGTKRYYLIGGYPPFIKNLIDDNKDQINWKDYNIDLVTGGEGVTLEWVYHVKKQLKPSAHLVSSYGASDIDIGIGFETPLSFFIRERVAQNQILREALFGKKDAPMVFQYNPTIHYIREVVSAEGKNEYEITLLDKSVAVPKIKYNLHDESRKFTYTEMMYQLEKHDAAFWQDFVGKSGGKMEDVLHLPFLCIFGRSDGTLSFDGANVFPNQIERSILKDDELEKKTSRFKIEKRYDKTHNVQFHIHIELKLKGRMNLAISRKYARVILDGLMDLNPDYKESYTKNAKLKPIIHLYPAGHPFFKVDDIKAKNNYIVKNVNK